jgi:hypothetical protein
VKPNQLLRAAIDQRDREQGVADDQLADAARMDWLDKAAFPKCRFCDRNLNEGNLTGVCSTRPECRKQLRAENRAKKALR